MKPAMEAGALFRRLVSEILSLRRQLAVLVASLVLLAGARLFLTWLVKVLSDDLLAHGAEARLETLISLASVTMAVIVVLVFVSQYAMHALNHRLVERLRNQAMRRLLVWDMPSFRARHGGELLSRVLNDAAALTGFARDVVRRLLGEGLVLAGSIAMMLYLDWRLALVAYVMVPLIALVLAPFGAVIRRAGALSQQKLGELTIVVEEQLRGISTVKGFQGEGFEGERFERENAAYRRQTMRAEAWSSLVLAAVWLVTGAGLIAIFGYGGWGVLEGRLTPGGLFAFCLYAAQTVEPLRHLSDVQTILQRGLAAAARVYEVIDHREVEATTLAAAARTWRGEVSFADVHFAYAPDKPVLRGLDLEIRPREALSLVAASGGGKSTLAALLTRFFVPQSGSIRLDGIDLAALPLAELRRAVCVVEQEPFVFSGSLLENLRYGSWSASDEQVRRAVRLAGLEPFVRSLPQGLAQNLAQAGKNLSGGQRQRIALARAILRDPAVLVLDEATSAVDGDTERQIFAGLEDWLCRRTVLVMAHRLSTVARFDRIAVLAAGRVADAGGLDELAGRSAEFRDLFGEQLAMARRESGRRAAEVA
jgi:subfamily B ATP-binding cassette protein MsbA